GFRLLASSVTTKVNDEVVALAGAEPLPARKVETDLVRTADHDASADAPEPTTGVPTIVLAIAVGAMTLGLAFMLWMRTQRARGDLVTAGSDASGGKGGQP